MSGLISLSIKETNLLRARLQTLVKLRQAYLEHPEKETVHDLRVASRRAREVLDYMEPILPQKWYSRLSRLARTITKSLGRVREAEVNLAQLSDWHNKGNVDPIVIEL